MNTFYVTEIKPRLGTGHGHVLVEHKVGATTAKERGCACSQSAALELMKYLAQPGDQCVITPLTGERVRFEVVAKEMADDGIRPTDVAMEIVMLNAPVMQEGIWA